MGLNALQDDELELLDTKGLEALSDDALARLDAEDAVETPSVISEAVGAVGRVHEGIKKVAGEAATPVAEPIQKKIAEIDESNKIPLAGLIAKLTGLAAGAFVESKAEDIPIPEVAKRAGKDVIAGAIQLGSGAGGALRAIGFENIGSMIAQTSAETAKNLMPPDPNIVDQVAQGLGSMAAFMLPGIGISTSASAVATVAPRLALFLGVATSSVLEAGIEAGDTFNRVMDKTGDRGQANTAAARNFWANVPLVHLTNKLGWAGDQSSIASRALESMLTEGAQEGSQELLGNFAANDPIMQGVWEAAFVGSLTGGMAGAAAHGVMKKGAPAETPQPPAGAQPSAPVQAQVEGAPAGVQEFTPASPPEPTLDVQPTAPTDALKAKVDQVDPENLLSGFREDKQIDLVPSQQEILSGAPAVDVKEATPEVESPKQPKKGNIRLESGREIPLPKQAKGTAQGIKKLDAWLVKTALEDAVDAKNDYAETLFKGLNAKKLSTSDRDTLNDYLFGSADGINLKTGERIGDRMSGARQEDMKKADAEISETPEQEQKRLGAVDSAVKQLEQAGYEPKVARTLSAVFEGFRVLGKRAGIDPQKLFDRYGIKIVRGSVEEAPADEKDFDAEVEGADVEQHEQEQGIGSFKEEMGNQRAEDEVELFRRTGGVTPVLDGIRKAGGFNTKKIKASKSMGELQGLAWAGIFSKKGGLEIDHMAEELHGKGIIAEYDQNLMFKKIEEEAAAISKFKRKYGAKEYAKLRRSLEQGEGDKARGRLLFGQDRRFTIELLENADLSTFLHETGHLYLEVLGDIASEKGTNQRVKDDYATLLKWMGAKSKEGITKEHHEKFARGFEAYLMEGKAPATRLQAAFQSFKEWLGAIYKQLSALDVELSPEVRQVMDRMLATDEEIATALDSAEKALARARKRKSEADSQAPPEIPQDAIPMGLAGVQIAEDNLNKAKKKARPIAEQAKVDQEPSSPSTPSSPSEANPGRISVDAKVAEAEVLRVVVAEKLSARKANEKEIRRRDELPGDKKAAAIAKIALLQKENQDIDSQIQELQKNIATIDEQAASLREAHEIEDVPVAGLVRKRPKGGKGGTPGASSGEFAHDTPVEMGGMEHIKPFRMPELVRLAYELMGEYPTIGGLKHYYGLFRGTGGGEIKLNPIIFQKPEQAAKTLAHEIGHLIDYLPDHNLKRGNLIGRLKSLRSFLSNKFGALKVTNKEIRDELLAVTMYWHPYDPEASSASYLAYRRSSVELYADAISVLFTSPGTLERMAPNFYREFFEGLDAKPAVKLAFFQLQEFLNAPELQIQEARHLDRRAMYLKAEDIWKQKRAEKDQRDNRYGEWIKQLVVDKHQKVIGEVEAAASNGAPMAPSKDPRYILEEMSLADNSNHAFLEEVDAKVTKPLADAELSHLDIGDYLYLTRVALGDRQAFANPKGYNPEEAQKALEFMKGRLRDDRYANLEAIAGAFRDIVFSVSEEAVEVGAYNKKVFDEKIRPNKGSYAVFAVQEYLEDYVAAGVKEQIGTLKDIANPFTATIMKIVGLNRLIAKQKGANAVRDFLVPRGEATEAEVVARGDKLTQFRNKKGFGLLELLEDGKPAAYYVDPYIAEAFEKKEAGTFHLAVKVLDSIFNGLFRPLYITFNIGFQMFSNPIRDFSRTRRNVYALVQNSGYAATVKNIMLAYARSLGAAGRRAAGIQDDLISEMIANKSLDITFTDYAFDPDADQYTSVMRKMGLSDPKQGGFYDKASKVAVLKPLVMVLEAIRFVGNTFESVSKIAGYKVLKADSMATLNKAIAEEKDPKEKEALKAERALLEKGKGEFSHKVAYNTRNYVGTPNWRRKGTITKISNTIFPFSNIMIQGYRSDLEIATVPTTRTGFMLDLTLTQIMPKLLMFLAALGGAGDELEDFFGKVSEYDKSNYIIIPIGFAEDGKAVYARIPHDELGRLSAAIFWKMANGLRGDPKALQQIIDFGAGQMPKLSPPLTIGATWVAYLSGKNPYDDFRGRPILPEKVHKAGGVHALKKMVQWTMNMTGLSSFATHDDATKTTAESILELTPVLNRVIKISDYGEHEQDMAKIADKHAEDARRSLDRGAAAKSYTKERYILSQKKSMDEISSEERVRLSRLNKYYSHYESYSAAIRRAREKGDPDRAQMFEDRLEKILEKVVE